MKGILLINMGSASSEKEMKTFLCRMFNDPAILPLPLVLRKMVAFMISSLRYKKSWTKYQQIGGSPLKESMNSINEALSTEVGKEYLVYNTYSYSEPLIKEGVEYFTKEGIEEIIVLPLYPQSSISTTVSVTREILKLSSDKKVTFNFRNEFYSNTSFISFWKELINDTIRKNNLTSPLLLFSAHSIPQKHIEQGDHYVQEIEETAQLIAEGMKLSYKVSFQSKMGKVKWVEPDTKSVLKELSSQKAQDIIIIPISFVTENLETLYDLDQDIIPFGRDQLKIKNLCRVVIPPCHPLLVKALKESIIKEL